MLLCVPNTKNDTIKLKYRGIQSVRHAQQGRCLQTMPPDPTQKSSNMTDFDHDTLTKSKANAAAAACGWNFIVLMSRQGKIRLSEFFSSYTDSQKKRILRDIAADVLPRQAKMCNIIEKGEYKFIYRRYASLYFIVGAPAEMNELIVLEQIHLFVEALDGYFNSGKCHSYGENYAVLRLYPFLLH